MKIPVPRRVQSADRLLNDVQDATAYVIRQIVQFEELAGVRLNDVALTTTAQTFSHGLGRCPIGWRVVDKTAAGDPYRTAWDERTISLRVASGSITCDIFVW